MAVLSLLREHLRGDLADIVRIAGERRFENEYLERSIFEALQQHNRTYTWAALPIAEEQLVLLLAKAKIAWDFSLNYALDAKMQMAQGIRDKASNAEILRALAKDLREEYEAEVALIMSDPDEGEITVGTLIRTDYGTRQKAPNQGATKPGKPVITSADYSYDPNLGGRIHWTWARSNDFDLAFVQVLIGRSNPVTPYNGTVVRTLYDVFSDPMAIPTIPSLGQQEAWMSYTLIPTGRYYMAMVAHNWNRLSTISDSVTLDVENFIEIPADSYVVTA